ncbi:MAG: rubredoxin [Christensenellaceae bacterium]|jgi:rubredoxin|nr:rubredoxin [Christensenellaceae bacterium]
MAKYVCSVCGYIYDEEQGDLDNGIEPNTIWADVHDDYTCPMCGMGKSEFYPE